jgi:hypothetical protein
MKKRPIHENLSTSFVDLAALVRHLRGLQFVGSIRFEMSSYDADIVFTLSNKLQAREHDHLSGRKSEGAHALRRILQKARDPHGRIHVYRQEPIHALNPDRVYVDATIIANARAMAKGRGDKPAQRTLRPLTDGGAITERRDRDEFVDLIAAILRTIESSLAAGNLSFSAAFQNSCQHTSNEFPFFEPDAHLFSYDNGVLCIAADFEGATVIAGLTDALERVLCRLRGTLNFEKTLHSTRQNLMKLLISKKQGFDKHRITPLLHELLRS